MNAIVEKRVLQIVVALACLVPLTAGPLGVVRGAAWMADGAALPTDLDSHFRYMSGIFTGVGLAFASCIPGIETKGRRMRMLVAFVVLGGLARLFSLIELGTPSLGNQFGLVMELVVTPCGRRGLRDATGQDRVPQERSTDRSAAATGRVRAHKHHRR